MLDGMFFFDFGRKLDHQLVAGFMRKIEPDVIVEFRRVDDLYLSIFLHQLFDTLVIGRSELDKVGLKLFF